MKNKRLSIVFLSIIIIICLGVRQGAARSIKFFVLSPPEQLLEDVKKIAIPDFVDAGTHHPSLDGERAAAYIIEILLEKERGIHSVSNSILESLIGKKNQGKTYQHGFETDFYTIVERSQINRIIQEQRFSHSSLVDQKQAAKLGKLLGVDAIIIGTADVTANKQRCYDKSKKEYYYKYEAAATLSMRIIGVSSGEIIGQKELTKTVNAEERKESKTSKKFLGKVLEAVSKPESRVSLDRMRKEAIMSAAYESVLYFAPTFRLETIELKTLKSKECKKKGKRAIRCLQRDEFADSLAIYTAIVEEDPYNHRAIYNQGVIHEMASDYDKALGRYNMAYQIYNESNDYHRAIERVEGQKALWAQLERIGIQMTGIDIHLTEGHIDAGGMDRVKLRGSSKIRIPVYASPGKGKVITKVPGGISLDFISNEKEFYKVKLINGQEGYIHIKDAKR
jgi:tetratricopeptide (TPR) repeat protein